MIVLILGFGIFLLLLGIFSMFFVHKGKQRDLLPRGKIVFNDLKGESYSLYSTKYPLVGKPDLIFKKRGKFIPVEIKTGNHIHPKNHHVMQLISYCQLITEHYGKITPYGYLIYPDTGKRFKISFDRLVKKQLSRILSDMSESDSKNRIMRNHDEKYRCNHCNLNKVCNQRI